jgi:hypothetical protein
MYNIKNKNKQLTHINDQIFSYPSFKYFSFLCNNSIKFLI